MTGFRACAERIFLPEAPRISVLRAKAISVIVDVLPPEKLWQRAWALAQNVARQPASSARHPRVAFTQPVRRRLFDELGYGLALEGLAAIALSH